MGNSNMHELHCANSLIEGKIHINIMIESTAQYIDRPVAQTSIMTIKTFVCIIGYIRGEVTK